MQREERVTVQGPVKEQQPDGMSHRGACSFNKGDTVFWGHSVRRAGGPQSKKKKTASGFCGLPPDGRRVPQQCPMCEHQNTAKGSPRRALCSWRNI